MNINKHNFIFLSIAMFVLIGLTTISATDDLNSTSDVVGVEKIDSQTSTIDTDIKETNINEKTNSISKKNLKTSNQDNHLEYNSKTNTNKNLKQQDNVKSNNTSTSKSLKTSSKMGTNIKVNTLKTTASYTTFNITVKSGTTHLVKSGQVNVYNQSNIKIGNGSVKNGTATITVSPNKIGTQKFTIKYMGNNVYYPSKNTTLSLNITKAGTNIKISVLKSQIVNTTFKVTVKSGSSYVISSGKVNAYDEYGTYLGSGSVKNGIALVTVSPKHKGSQEFKLKFMGNSIAYSSLKTSVYANVVNAGTNIKVDVLKSNIVNTTFRVTVKSGNVHKVVSGQVNVYDSDGDKLGSGIVKKGIATITFSPNWGYNKFTIKYMGDSTYYPSKATTLTVNITKAGTNIKVDVLKSNAVNTTFKVTVKSGNYLYVQSGNVGVYDSKNKLLTKSKVNNGTAYLLVAPGVVKNKKFVIKYIGDSTYYPSKTTSKILNTTKAGTNIQVSILNNRTISPTFNVIVKSGNYLYVQSGTVKIFDSNGTVLTTAQVDNGSAKLNFTTTKGIKKYTIQYIGDSTYYSSKKLTQTLNISVSAIYVRSDGDDYYGTGTYANPYLSIYKAVVEAGEGYEIVLDGTFDDLGLNTEYVLIEKNLTINGGTFKGFSYGSRIFYILKGCTVNITNATFDGITSRELIHNEGTLNIINCTFKNNAILYNNKNTTNTIIKNNGKLNIRSSTFESNSGIDKGIIYNTVNGTLTIIKSTFTSNKAIYHAGVIYNAGKLTVKQSTFTSNKARYTGGAILNNGTANIEKSTFKSNYARGVSKSERSFGGGICNFGTLTVTNSSFSSNRAVGYGGAIYTAGTTTIKNTNFTNNKGNGSCVYVDSISAKQYQWYYLGQTATSYYSAKVTVSNSQIRQSNSAFYANSLTSTDSRVKIENNYFDKTYTMKEMFTGINIPEKYYYL